MQRFFRLKVLLLGVAFLLAVTVTSVSAEEATTASSTGEATAEATSGDNDTTKEEPFDKFPEKNWCVALVHSLKIVNR